MKDQENGVSFVLYTPEFRQAAVQTQLNTQLYERFAKSQSSAIVKTDRFIASGPVIPIHASANENAQSSQGRKRERPSYDWETQPVNAATQVFSLSAMGMPNYVQLVNLSQSNALQNRLNSLDGLTRQLSAARETESLLSAGADLFIYTGDLTSSDVLPPYNQSRFGILYADVPRNLSETADKIAGSCQTEFRLSWLENLYARIKSWRVRSAFRWEWASRIATYNAFWVTSEFCQKIMAKRWRQFGKVVYPPLTEEPVQWTPEAIAGKKRQIVCCVNHKNQVDIILDGFEKLYRGLPKMSEEGWKLILAVELFDGVDAEDQQVRRLAERLEKRVQSVSSPSVEMVQVRTLTDRLNLFKESAMFLDATGFDLDWKRNPEVLPGFHLAAADAMSVGAIPIVYCAGSVPEIVLHEQSGFLWHKPEEMWASVFGLIQNEQLRFDVAILSTVRAQFFSQALWEKRTQLANIS